MGKERLRLINHLFDAVHDQHLEVVAGNLPTVYGMVTRADAEKDLAGLECKPDVARLLLSHAAPSI